MAAPGPGPATAARCLVVEATATLAATTLVGWLLPSLMATPDFPPSPVRFEEWLVLGCEAAALAATGWLWLLVTLVTLEAAGRPSRGHRGVPPRIRELVLAACGAGLAGCLAVPAHATPTPSPLTGLPLPDRPTTRALPHPDGAAHLEPAVDRGRGPDAAARSVRVAPGDCLWALAGAELPPTASHADIDARWHALHDANRDVIGEDPDLIRPGQLLRLPPVPH